MNTTTTRAVSRWVILMLALGAGFSVASIYYAQPLLPLMGSDLNLSIEGMGMVPTLTQAGYALGILFLLPLGDRHDRRTLILIKSAALALFLLGCSLTGQLHSLLLTSLLIGMAATMVADRPLQGGWQGVEAAQQILNRQCGQLWRPFQCGVEVVDIGLVMTAVVDLHGQCIDMGFQCVVGIVQGWQGMAHDDLCSD